MVEDDDDADAEPSSMDELRRIRPVHRRDLPTLSAETGPITPVKPPQEDAEPHPSDDEEAERTLIAPSPFDDVEYPGRDEPLPMTASLDDALTRVPVPPAPVPRPAAGRRPSYPDHLPAPVIIDATPPVQITARGIRRTQRGIPPDHRMHLAMAFAAGLSGGLAFVAILYTILGE